MRRYFGNRSFTARSSANTPSGDISGLSSPLLDESIRNAGRRRDGRPCACPVPAGIGGHGIADGVDDLCEEAHASAVELFMVGSVACVVLLALLALTAWGACRRAKPDRAAADRAALRQNIEEGIYPAEELEDAYAVR